MSGDEKVPASAPAKTEAAALTLEKLIEMIQSYYPEADVGLIKKAHDFSVSLHEGQKRQSGEPYIIHPLAVSGLLAQMKMDVASIVTGLLHDTVEDTATTLEQVQKEFGPEIAQLVDGVTKISAISFKSSHEKQAENFRKMILAMAKDLRVILVKLADRTHNMRTLEFLSPNKQMAIAQETLDIYAPLANRLGISWMKLELEDLCLRHLHPEIYYKLAKLVSKKKGERNEYIEKVAGIFHEKLSEYGLKVKITGRSKHFYSIYKKMEARGVDFDDINDLIAFRIITGSVQECYEALGIMHMFFKPIPGRFKDYIAMPKNNMYQSLHTTVIGPFGERLEVQIRTDDMHRTAEGGIAAHWEYKEGKLSQKDSLKFHWLRQLVEAQESLQDPSEFLESVKLDLFEGDIYVFTPKGELREFPQGSTPLDFAYSVHTDLGNKCTGSKVNGRIVPLKHKLRSGDTVEIITSPTQRPSKDWLKICKSSRAKAKIRQYLKTEERETSRKTGQNLLDREFRRFGQSLPKFEKSKDLEPRCQAIGFASYDELLIQIGYGKLPVGKTVLQLFPDLRPAEETPVETHDGGFQKIIEKAKDQFGASTKKNVVRIHGMDDILVRMGRCCNPLPGDEIIGFISRGRGVTVHKLGCSRVLDLNKDRVIEVSWASEADRTARDIRIKVLVQDEQGLLNEMSRVISSHGINIKSLNIRVNVDNKATGIFDLQVKTKDQLIKCMRELEGLKGIISVERIPLR